MNDKLDYRSSANATNLTSKAKPAFMPTTAIYKTDNAVPNQRYPRGGTSQSKVSTAKPTEAVSYGLN